MSFCKWNVLISKKIANLGIRPPAIPGSGIDKTGRDSGSRDWKPLIPGVQAVSPQVTWSHSPGGRLPLLSARPAVAFPAEERHRQPLAGSKLYCLVIEAHACEQLAQGCYLEADRPRFEPATFWIASERFTVKPQRLIDPSRPQTMYADCSRFHPNRFNLGGVVAERVNTAKTRRKVSPIFDWSLASSRITTSHMRSPNPIHV